MNKTAFENGMIVVNGATVGKISDIPWSRHPKFEGVFLKNLFDGKESNNNFSQQLVKIEGGCEIGNHIHEGKAELHEVLFGEGKTIVNQTAVEYRPGIISLIPANVPHSVKAHADGLIMLAKFTPPLN